MEVKSIINWHELSRRLSGNGVASREELNDVVTEASYTATAGLAAKKENQIQTFKN